MVGKKEAAAREKALDGLKNKIKQCPMCLDKLRIGTGFGIRLSAGKYIAQSYCKGCRGSGDKVAKAKPVKKPIKSLKADPVQKRGKPLTKKAKTVNEPSDRASQITTLKDDTARMYAKEFPNDKASRGWFVQAQKLAKKGYPLSPEAKNKLSAWELGI